MSMIGKKKHIIVVSNDLWKRAQNLIMRISTLFPNNKLSNTMQILNSLCYFPYNFCLTIEILVLNVKIKRQLDWIINLLLKC